VIASELNRIAVRLRELIESEAGRRQMEFQLSDAVLQSIFEPIIVTDGKGHVLKVNQAAAELMGEAATDRMALANTPGGDKILSAIRDAVSMQKPVPQKTRPRCCPCGSANRSAAIACAPPHARLRRQAAGTVTTLEDVTTLQDTTASKTQFISVASRKLRDPVAAVAPRPLCLGHGFGGELLPCRRNWWLAPGARARSWTI